MLSSDCWAYIDMLQSVVGTDRYTSVQLRCQRGSKNTSFCSYDISTEHVL